MEWTTPIEAYTTALEKQSVPGWGRHPLTLYSFVSSLNFKLNTKRYVPKAFLSPFVDGMVMAQNLARWYAIPPHFKP